ncbi:MAG: ribosome small subunit-dependent GTPase A [Chloroflexi bacterium]|nr:ribosome small subunit-dependent GTPase A [Chloroflexota bacterium]
MPSENLSRRTTTRIEKWQAEKQERRAKKDEKRKGATSEDADGPLSASAPRLLDDDTGLIEAGDLDSQPQAAEIVPLKQEQAPAEEVEATVVEVHAAEVLVSLDGAILRAHLGSSLFSDAQSRNPVAVGDQVLITLYGSAPARVESVLPRRSSLARGSGDASRGKGRLRTQIFAANIDQVIVVSAAEPPFNPRLIDRFLVAASRDELPAVLCVNKLDLGLSSEAKANLEGYAALGFEILLTSTVTGEGIDSLIAAVSGKTSLLTGHSGVGKSSLLNAIEPGLARRVGSVTQAAAGQGKGTHTTSSSRLVPLSTPNTFMVDTPGIRSFGITGLEKEDLAAHFSDILQLAESCEFRNCLHDGELGCALPAASSKSAFLDARWKSYLTLLSELH